MNSVPNKLLRVTKKVSLKNFKRQVNPKNVLRSTTVKMFPIVMENTLHDKCIDIHHIITDIAVCDTLTFTLEVALVLLSIESKNMYKNKFNLDSTIGKTNQQQDVFCQEDHCCVLTCYEDSEGETYCSVSEGGCGMASDEGDV